MVSFVGPDLGKAQVIGQDEDDVRLWRRLSPRVRAKQESEHSEESRGAFHGVQGQELA